MMNFLKDWIIQYQNKFSVGGVETTIDRITGTVSQEGDTINASYLNEIQKNCIYQVNATRVIEGVLEIYDISINGSEDFTSFNQTFLIDFDVTNTQVDSLLRFNGITYSLRFSDSVSNGDISPKIGDISKRALVKLDVLNSKALILDVKPSILYSPAFSGIPTAPTATIGIATTQIATTAFATGQDLGVGQVPQNVTAGRAIGTKYTNSTGKPYMVCISVRSVTTSNDANFYINEVQVLGGYISTSSGNYTINFVGIVPAGGTYKVLSTGFSLTVWTEIK